MLIRRKVFSVLEDETGEERLFSTNEVEYLGDEFYEVDDRMFAEGEKKDNEHKISLSEVNSHRGLGRSLVLGGPGLGGVIGGYVSKKKANKLDEEGANDIEIIKGATKQGRRVGAASGTIIGAAGIARNIAENPIVKNMDKKQKAAYTAGMLAASTAFGALGGHLGAKKNAKTRLDKRAGMESRMK